MKCPNCGGYQTVVIDSRLTNDDAVRRRRRGCEDCGKRWSTIELPLGIGKVRRVVLCEDCTLQGKCLVESTLKKAGSKSPYCSEGKRKGDNALFIDEEVDDG